MNLATTCVIPQRLVPPDVEVNQEYVEFKAPPAFKPGCTSTLGILAEGQRGCKFYNPLAAGVEGSVARPPWNLCLRQRYGNPGVRSEFPHHKCCETATLRLSAVAVPPFENR